MLAIFTRTVIVFDSSLPLSSASSCTLAGSAAIVIFSAFCVTGNDLVPTAVVCDLSLASPLAAALSAAVPVFSEVTEELNARDPPFASENVAPASAGGVIFTTPAPSSTSPLGTVTSVTGPPVAATVTGTVSVSPTPSPPAGTVGEIASVSELAFGAGVGVGAPRCVAVNALHE